jgi:tyrosyl-tRNA synthetase
MNEKWTIKEQVNHLMRGTTLTGGMKRVMTRELTKALKKDRPLRVKLGMDPTKPFLHIGHLSPLLALKRFADLGHETYLLLGEFTALIGDPTGRRRRQAPLNEDNVAENVEIYKKEVFRVLDPGNTIVVDNIVWFNQMRVLDFMLEASQVTLANMLEHKNFRDRFDANQPIGLQELLYPVAQAVDSLVLCAAPRGQEDDPAPYKDYLSNPDAFCDVEIGGHDQLFNFTFTRDFMSQHNVPPQLFITTPLIKGRDRQKMGQTDANTISFNNLPTTIYNEMMAMDDSEIKTGLTVMTDIPDEELDEIKYKMDNRELDRHDAKQKWAFEVVSLVYDKEAALNAQEEYEARRYEKYQQVTAEKIFTLPPEIASKPVPVAELVFSAGLSESKSEANRLIQQGGIYIDEKRVSPKSKVLVENGMLLRRGQRRDARIVRLQKK